MFVFDLHAKLQNNTPFNEIFFPALKYRDGLVIILLRVTHFILVML